MAQITHDLYLLDDVCLFLFDCIQFIDGFGWDYFHHMASAIYLTLYEINSTKIAIADISQSFVGILFHGLSLI